VVTEVVVAALPSLKGVDAVRRRGDPNVSLGKKLSTHALALAG